MGEIMNKRISVLDIEIDELTAKEAMRSAMEYIVLEPLNVIEFVTAASLMRIREEKGLCEEVCRFDLVLAGDRAVLEAAEVSERKFFLETENRVFLKMFLRYLHKNHMRIYMLAESEGEAEQFYHYLEYYYRGIQIAGLAKVSAEDRSDEMLVNAINGGEVYCIFSMLSSPLQEEFIAENKSVLDARVFVGLGKDMLPGGQGKMGGGRFTRLVSKYLFKKEIEKHKKIEQIYAVK